jgi:hypothetical protein
MNESEQGIEELRLALGPIDFARAKRAAIALQKTRTIDLTRASQLLGALGILQDVVNSFPKEHRE